MPATQPRPDLLVPFLAPRLGRRAVVRRFAAKPERSEALAADSDLVWTGAPAAGALGWNLPPDVAGPLVVDGYVGEHQLAGVVERYGLEPDAEGPVCVRAVPEPWPLPPQQRLAPAVLVGPWLLWAFGGRGQVMRKYRDMYVDMGPCPGPDLPHAWQGVAPEVLLGEARQQVAGAPAGPIGRPHGGPAVSSGPGHTVEA
jgi:hypothetical protein